jgi:hypothetical protein
MGETLAGEGQGTLTVRAPAIEGATVVLLRDGRPVAQSPSGELHAVTSGPGAYRVEVRLSDRDARAPWIFSNPIYVDLPSAVALPATPDGVEAAILDRADWHTEHDPSSVATLLADGELHRMTYRLGQNAASPFAALVSALPRPAPAFDAVVLEASTDVPLRVSVQFRSRDGSARWRKSVYLGPGERRTVLRTSEFVPVERGGRTFEPAGADSVLLVVDLVNSRPGASGQLVLRHLALSSVR